MFKRIFTLAIIFGVAALAPPVAAQTEANCLTRDQVIEVLVNRYHEQATGAGLQSPYQMLEIWTSPETGTFTVLVSYPDGTSCVVASGSYWQQALSTIDGTSG